MWSPAPFRARIKEATFDFLQLRLQADFGAAYFGFQDAACPVKQGVGHHLTA